MSPRAKKDAFRVLGIAPTDDLREIRRAWREIVRTSHPDLVQENRAEATRNLAVVNDAYDLLMTAAHEARRSSQEYPREDVARRMAAARRAEARRAAEAREAEAERRAHAEHLARQAMRQAEAEARREAGAVVLSLRNPAVERAAAAFSRSIDSFTEARAASRFDTTC